MIAMNRNILATVRAMHFATENKKKDFYLFTIKKAMETEMEIPHVVLQELLVVSMQGKYVAQLY